MMTIYSQQKMRDANNTTVHVFNETVFGNYNKIYGNKNVIHGDYNFIYGNDCRVEGKHNKIYGLRAIMRGMENEVVVLGNSQPVVEEIQPVQGYQIEALIDNLNAINAQEEQEEQEYIIHIPAQEEEVEATDDQTPCIICYTNQVRTTVTDCGHTNMCISCARKLVTDGGYRCPTCKKIMTKIIRIYQ